MDDFRFVSIFCSSGSGDMDGNRWAWMNGDECGWDECHPWSIGCSAGSSWPCMVMHVH